MEKTVFVLNVSVVLVWVCLSGLDIYGYESFSGDNSFLNSLDIFMFTYEILCYASLLATVCLLKRRLIAGLVEAKDDPREI